MLETPSCHPDRRTWDSQHWRVSSAPSTPCRKSFPIEPSKLLVASAQWFFERVFTLHRARRSVLLPLGAVPLARYSLSLRAEDFPQQAGRPDVARVKKH
jgi:hypothetical protein